MTIVSTLQEIIRRLTRQEKAAEDIKRLVTNSPLHAGKAKALTIAGGAVEATRPHIQLAPETGLTDDLDNITNFGDGKFVVLSLQDGADTITVRDTVVSAGNIDLGGSNIILAEPEDNILLYYVATTAKWHKVGGAGSGAYSDELAQDAVGAMLADTATIDLTYTDATPELKADVIADSITNTLLANMAQNTIKGRITAGTGDPEDLTATQVRTIINVEDGANLYVHPNHTGDVTSVGDGATTIADDVVTNAKLAEVATSTIKGRVTAGTGNPEDLTATQARSVLNVEDGADVTDAGNVGSSIHGAAAKVTPVDADTMPLIDSEAGNVLKKVTWANIKATLKTYFDTLYNLYVHPNHTGDVTSVADGATTIANDAVTYAKIQNVSATDKLLGRATAGTGDVEEIPLTAAGRALIDDADAAAQRTTLGLGTMAVATATDYVLNVGNSGSYYERYIAVVPDMTSTQVCTIDISTASLNRPVLTVIRFNHCRGGAQQFFAQVWCQIRWRTGTTGANGAISSYEMDYHTSGTPNVTLTTILNGIRLTVGSSAFGNTMTQGSVYIESVGESVANLTYTVTVT